MAKMREKHPGAAISALKVLSNRREAPIRAAVKSRNDAGDTKVYFVDTTGWISREDTNDGVHPTAAGNQRIADKLAPMLEKALKGQAPQ